MRKSTRAWIMAAVMAVSLLSGCSGGSGSIPKDTAATGKEEGAAGKTEAATKTDAPTLVVAQTADTVTMDPQMQGKMPSMNILINIYDTLIARDADGNLTPGLATEWKNIDDHTWQFKLREGVKFHNGEDFTADDVQYSLMRLINPETKSPITELKYLTDVQIVDDYTVNLITSDPDPILPNKLVLFGGVIIPADYSKAQTPEYLAENPVGTGPYKFVSWAKDSEVLLEANEEYFRGVPAYSKLKFRVIPNWADMLAALQTGEVHLVSGANADLAQSAKSSPNLEVISADWIRTFSINLDTSVEPLNRKEVRQAMNYAVDKQAIIETMLGGSAKQVSTIIPKENYGYDETLEPYGYDPEKARELLAEAGYPDGFEVTFDATAPDISVIQAVCGYFEAVGIKINMNVIEPATLTSNIAAKTAAPLYYIGNTGWTMDALSNFQSFVKSDRRYCRFSDSSLDELVDTEETTIDSAIRLDAFQKAQRILTDEAYFVYLWQLDNIIIKARDVEYTPNKIGVLWMYDAKPAH